MSNKSSNFGVAEEMRRGIVLLAGERNWHETRQRWLERAAKAAGITYRAARSLFYAEPHAPRPSVIARVRRAVETREAKARDELLSQLSVLEERLRTIDPDFHRDTIAALGNALSELRKRLGGARDKD